MYLIALLSRDASVVAALSRYADSRFHIHPVSRDKSTAKVLEGLGALEFAGALVFGHDLQEQAIAQVQRTSLDAREANRIDTITVTPAGLVGDLLLGRALGLALRKAGWDGRGARAVVMGSGPDARVAARELGSLGVRHITVLAEDRPSAERSVPPLPSTTEVDARAVSEPVAALRLEQADVLVRTDAALEPDLAMLGPHLNVVDFSPDSMSRLRQAALGVGGRTLGLRDVQAHQVSLALGHILGSPLEVDLFLGIFHGGA